MVRKRLKPGAADVKEITVLVTLENIRTVTDFINEELAHRNVPEMIRVQIDVAIDEIFGNIVRYAYNDQEGRVTVRADIEGERPTASITFIDKGKPYDPREAPEPDITLEARLRPIGGLGLFMVRKIMDGLDYEYRDGQNILTIRKAI